MSKPIRVGIIGAAGYTGGELLRILLRHPHVQIVYAQSTSNAGNPLYTAHPDLQGETALLFSADWHTEVDVLLLCMGHGQAKKWLTTNQPPATIRLIDLSNDFRLAKDREVGPYSFVYGLPEFQRAAIRSATAIANPGCFATAIQLSALPIAQAGILHTLHVSGITGSTGAGQALSDTVHFSWRNNNVQAYKVLAHQHIGEVEQTLHEAGSPTARVLFVPYRGDFTRGIYVTTYTDCAWTLEEAYAQFTTYYAGHPFVTISTTPIDLKQVVNTNKALLYMEKLGDQLAIHAVIDNLTKGASGQAVQNMNLLFGLEETTGLWTKGSAF